MDTFFFFLISSLEYLAMGVFLKTMFRIRGNYWFEILVSCTIMCLVSYFTRFDVSLQEWSSFIQSLVFIILVKLFFRLSWKNSIMTGGISYNLYVGIQLLVYIFFMYTGLIHDAFDINKDDGRSLTLIAHGVQVLAVLITLFISLFIKQKNLGWSFVSDTQSEVITNSTEKKLIMSVIALIMITNVVVMFMLIDKITTAFILSTVLLVVSMSVLFIGHRREEEELDL